MGRRGRGKQDETNSCGRWVRVFFSCLLVLVGEFLFFVGFFLGGGGGGSTPAHRQTGRSERSDEASRRRRSRPRQLLFLGRSPIRRQQVVAELFQRLPARQQRQRPLRHAVVVDQRLLTVHNTETRVRRHENGRSNN